MDCRHCTDAERLGCPTCPRLRCIYSLADVTHDADLEGTCPRNLELVTREGAAVAQTVLAVTLLLDPTGALMTRLLSRYGEWQGAQLRALMGREALVGAIHGERDPSEVDTPGRWERRYGGWGGATERQGVTG